MTNSARRDRLAVPVVALAQLCGTAVWFAGTAAVPDLSARWHLSPADAAWLTTVVQLGFIAGTLLLASTALADRVPAHWLFCGSALAAALANLDILEGEDLTGHVRAHEDEFRAALEGLRDLPIVGDVRGMGYFYGIELVKDTTTKETFTEDEADFLLRGELTPQLISNGLLCRADDRGEPVIQLSPPLTAGPEEFEEMARAIRASLLHAMDAMEQMR